MAASNKPRPRLKNLDDLFALNNGVNPIIENEAMSQRQDARRGHSIIAVNRLTPFEGHPFRLYDGERLEDMVQSVKANGVLVPIIVRQIGDVLQILSGHNRVNAAKLAGLETVPAIVLDSIPDEEAMIYVVETNLMQRSFADMAHSEKAAVIALHHSKLFSQGKRNDILEQLLMLENSSKRGGYGTSPQLGAKLRTDEKVGEKYSLSKNTVARYLRIHQLIPAMKDLLDNGVIAFISAVTLSFLSEREQKELARCLELSDFKVDMKKADILRQYSEKGKLNDEALFLILNGEIGQKPKPNRTPAIKINKAVYSKYFRPGQSAQEIQEIVEKALEMYFKSVDKQ